MAIFFFLLSFVAPPPRRVSREKRTRSRAPHGKRAVPVSRERGSMATRHRGRQTQRGITAAAVSLGIASSSSSSSSKQRRRSRRGGGHAIAHAAGLGLLLLWTAGAGAQFTDGGDISMSCGDCDCTGSSDAGTVVVFQNPSSGGNVAKVEGELTEVVETSCGKSVIAVGTTIFELSGVDFGSREQEVVDLSSGECSIDAAPSNADCDSGTSSHDLSGGAKLDLTLCLCTSTVDTVSKWNVNVQATATGASKVAISGLEGCPDNGYTSQLLTAEVDGEAYLFNFDLVQPGKDSSADLSVGSGPSSDAQAFICGEEEEEPEPEPEPEPEVSTPAPIPVPEPPEEPEEEVVEETPAPSPPATEEPDPEPETPSPVDPDPETSPPTDSTAATTSSSSSTTPAEVETPAPMDVETPAPVGATRGLETPAPVTAAPVAAAATGAPVAAPTPPSTTPGPTLAPTPEATRAPLTEAELEQIACKWPLEDPCTPTTPVANITQGLGAYYDPTCSGAGCGVGPSGVCRTCYFDTVLYKEQSEEGAGEVQMPDYAQCPCCVLEVYDEPYAQDEDGPRCVNATPAPTTTALDTETRDFESLDFEDNPLSLAGGEAIALGALGLFGVLTFLPFCTK